MNTGSAQIEPQVEIPEISIVPKSTYSEMWVSVADGIYKYTPNGMYYYRPLLPGGKRTYRSLKTTNLKIAKERYHALCSQNGLLAESKLTVGDIIDRYEKDGFLDVTLDERPDVTEADEKRHCETLRKFWSKVLDPDVTDMTCDLYFKWRKKPENLKQGKGRRATDRELNTLNNAFRYAKRCGMIRVNQLADRPTYQKSTSVHHCREFCPRDADELHTAAALFFEHPDSVVLGFQLLAEANTRLRASEALQWGNDVYGTTTPEGKYVYVWRLKNANPSVSRISC